MSYTSIIFSSTFLPLSGKTIKIYLYHYWSVSALSILFFAAFKTNFHFAFVFGFLLVVLCFSNSLFGLDVFFPLSLMDVDYLVHENLDLCPNQCIKEFPSSADAKSVSRAILFPKSSALPSSLFLVFFFPVLLCGLLFFVFSFLWLFLNEISSIQTQHLPADSMLGCPWSY